MPKKEDKIYLGHILDSISSIEKFVSGYTKESFIEDDKTFNACIRMFEVMGEATKRLSQELREKHSTVEWKEVAGFRDVLIHDYEGVDLVAVWKIISTNIPELKQKINQIYSNIN